MFASACSGFVAPEMTEATCGRASSHAIASSSMVCPRSSAKRASFSTPAEASTPTQDVMVAKLQ